MVTRYIYNQPSSTLTVGGKTYAFGDDCTDLGPELLHQYRFNVRAVDADEPAPAPKTRYTKVGTTSEEE